MTECGGRHRFSYTGHPSGSGLRPLGICTTALSHILVCDSRTDTVQMFDKNGQFLSHLLTKSQTMGELRCLSYDINTHCLWVGSRFNNMVVMYKYITRQDSRTGNSESFLFTIIRYTFLRHTVRAKICQFDTNVHVHERLVYLLVCLSIFKQLIIPGLAVFIATCH